MHLFDEDGSGDISKDEFIRGLEAMKTRGMSTYSASG